VAEKRQVLMAKNSYSQLISHVIHAQSNGSGRLKRDRCTSVQIYQFCQMRSRNVQANARMVECVQMVFAHVGKDSQGHIASIKKLIHHHYCTTS
jgi:hypothetical protein